MTQKESGVCYKYYNNKNLRRLLTKIELACFGETGKLRAVGCRGEGPALRPGRLTDVVAPSRRHQMRGRSRQRLVTLTPVVDERVVQEQLLAWNEKKKTKTL